MKNRKLLLIVSLVLAMTMSLGGTLAYLTDTDADVNTMTLGNVEIVQNEQEWNSNKTELQEFTQDKALLPYVGTMGWENTEENEGAYRRFTMSNVVDKYVTVTNKGNTDAFVRTIIAVEMGEYTTVEEFRNNIVGVSRNVLDGEEFDFPGTWEWDKFYVAEIDDSNYMIMTATHKDAVAAKETTIPSLLQVYVNKDCDNEDLVKIDGNENGKLDILVISQAVQANGFEATEEKSAAQVALEEAFPYGEDKAMTVAGWFESIGEEGSDYQIGSPDENYPESGKNDTNLPPVFTVEDVVAMLEAGKSVSLATNIELTETVNITGDVKLDLNGYKLNAADNEGRPFNVADGASLTIDAQGAEIECGKYGLATMTEGTLTVNGGTFTNDAGNDGAFIKVDGDEEMVINLNNVTYKAGTPDSGVLRTTGANVTVNVTGGEYEAGMGFVLGEGSTVTGAKITATNAANMWPAVYAVGAVTVENCAIESACHAIAVAGGETITVNNCNVTVPDGKLAFQVFSSGGTINVNDCTWTGTYGTTGPIKSGCPDAVINIDDVEKYRKAAK